MSFQIKYFKKNEVTKSAFETNSSFYGVGSLNQPYSTIGYPNSNASLAGAIDLTAHEMVQYIEGGTTLTINGSPTPSATVTVGDTIIDQSWVGAYIFDATDPQEPEFLCVVESTAGVVGTETNTFTADRTFSVDINATEFFIQKTNSANFSGFKPDEAFYILVQVKNPASSTSTFPQIKAVCTSFSNLSGETDSSFIALERYSLPGIPETAAMTTENVPCTVRRVNSFLGGNLSSTYFKTNNDKPFWVCWEINPYGNSASSLSKKTLYSIEVIEDLPETSVAINFTYSSAEAGYI